MTFEDFKTKFGYHKTDDLRKNCTQCKRFDKFQTCKPLVTGICRHFFIEDQEDLSCLTDQEGICSRYLPNWNIAYGLSDEEKQLEKLEEAECQAISKEHNDLIESLIPNYDDNEELTEEQKIALIAEVARDDYGESAFSDDVISQTELCAAIAGDPKLEMFVENEKKLTPNINKDAYEARITLKNVFGEDEKPKETMVRQFHNMLIVKNKKTGVGFFAQFD